MNRAPLHSGGFTLVELLVVMAVSGILIAALLSMVSSSQRLFAVDSTRSTINQDLSVALTAVTNNARELGEQLNSSFPALTVTGPPQARVLTLRRNLIDVVLPVCREIRRGSNTDVVFVSKQGQGAGTFPASCQETSAAAQFQLWTEYRKAHKGVVNAYIYDPVTQAGENFTYDAEDRSGFHIHQAGKTWQNDYPLSHTPRVYLLEQLSYTLNNGVLYQTSGAGQPQAFLPNVSSFEVYPYVTSASGTPTRVTTDFPTSDTTWKDLTSVQLRVTGRVSTGGTTVQRTFTSQFIPRNVESVDQ